MNSGFVVMTRSVFLCACTRDVAVARLCDSGMLGGLGVGKRKGNKKKPCSSRVGLLNFMNRICIEKCNIYIAVLIVLLCKDNTFLENNNNSGALISKKIGLIARFFLILRKIRSFRPF
jgi:hypothetical protein